MGRMSEQWTRLKINSQVEGQIRPRAIRGWNKPKPRRPARHYHFPQHRQEYTTHTGSNRGRGSMRDPHNPWNTSSNHTNKPSNARHYRPKQTKKPSNPQPASTQSSLPPILQSMLGTQVSNAAMQRLQSLDIN